MPAAPGTAMPQRPAGRATATRIALPLLVLAAAATLPVQAASAESAGPLITSHSQGEAVSGEIVVTVQSTAPVVLVDWKDDLDRKTSTSFPQDVVDGEANVEVSTSGYDGLTTIVARECTESWVCDGPESSIQLTVSNPPPKFHDRTWLDEHHDEFLTFWLDEDSFDSEEGWAHFGWFFDGEFLPGVEDSRLLMTESSYLGEGVHTVQVARCTRSSREHIIEPPVCDMGNASEMRSFRIRTALHPEITRVRPRTISPDGNGVADHALVTALADTSQWSYWRLEEGDEFILGGGTGMHEPGTYSFEVGVAEDEAVVPDGTYTLRLDAFHAESDIHGTTSTTLTVDTRAPKVSDPSATPQVLHPPRDGFKDQVRFSGTLSEHASRARVRLWRAGVLRRFLPLGPQPPGVISTTWHGHRRNGKLAAPGTYRYEFVVVDRWGNRAVRRGGQITVRH